MTIATRQKGRHRVIAGHDFSYCPHDHCGPVDVVAYHLKRYSTPSGSGR